MSALNTEYSIKKVAKLFNISSNKIRFYEEKGLLSPKRDHENEYRKFNDQDIIKLQAILLYRSMGIPIDQIKELLSNNNKMNFLNHFNNQWQVVNNEIQRLNVIRESLEEVLDNIYESKTNEITTEFLEIIEKGNKINNIKDSWKDRWDFNDWAKRYDDFIKEDKGNLNIYKNYELILEDVYNKAINTEHIIKNILEIGVGTGNLASKFLNKDINIIGIDQSREMLAVAKEKFPRLKVRLGEFLKIPYCDKFFDVIVSTYAFHHLNNQEKCIAIVEMLRVLKDNGKIVIGDLMFRDDKEEKEVLKNLDYREIEIIKDEYYSHIDFLEKEFIKYDRKLSYTKVDNLNYIIEVK
ncbi:methyltransferase domain-containing protein [Clostridium sp. 'White wine YQ']|nr:methyltransferase domain-containing protein [Clostridium sp. 'White wine YQ']MDD7793603.1 methyltransferase domain-containing protein [Clostridium sp. 'White wine YQ']